MNTPQDHVPAFVHQPSLLERIQDKLAASRFLTYSLLFHVILLALFSGIVVVKSMAPEADFPAMSGPIDDGPPPVDPVKPPILVSEPKIKTPLPDAPKRIDEIISSTAKDSTFAVAPPPPPVLKGLPGDLHSLPSLGQIPGGFSGHPTSMNGRPGGKLHDAMKAKWGMKAKSEEAVAKGLRWLKEHQNADGSWSTQYVPSMTGLALLCFLGHGELPQSPEFGPAVKKGVDWVLANGTKFGGRLSMTPAMTSTGAYEHGIVTYALGEYYTMTRDDRVRDVLTQAVAHIVAGQAPDGGWQYAYAKGPNSDTSVTGWQIQALKAAHLSGLNLPGVEEALDKAMLDLKRVNGPRGGFGYVQAEDRYSLTGAGVLCTYFWKGEKDRMVRDGISFIVDETEKNYPVQYKGDKGNLYAWYYHGQACLMFGGSAWTRWNKWFQDEITGNQSADGSWPAMPGKQPGLQSDEKGAGPFYRTTLCVLMLEVYYRYMPTNSGK